MNVLISSCGRRVGLIQCFRESQMELGIGGRVIGIDVTRDCSAAHFVDGFHLVPVCTHPKFLPTLAQICEREQIDIIVPTIDIELPIYADVKDDFRARGTAIAVSAPETVDICRDKTLTHSWLSRHSFSVPRQSTPEDVLARSSEWNLPLIFKPHGGSASAGVQVLDSFEALASACKTTKRFLVQERIEGQEYTVNVFVDRQGQCICAVPHARIETRAGEVSKAVTVKNPVLMDTVMRLVQALPGAYGALNVQCFLTATNDICIIEINARFGGGYPLAHKAGAKITSWLLGDTLGSGPQSYSDAWQDGLLMLRYDEAVYTRTCDHVSSGLSAASRSTT